MRKYTRYPSIEQVFSAGQIMQPKGVNGIIRTFYGMNGTLPDIEKIYK